MDNLWTRKIVFLSIFLICFISNGLASLYFGYIVNKQSILQNFISRTQQSTILIKKSLQEGDYRTYVFYTKNFFSSVGEDVGIRLYSKVDKSEILSIDMESNAICSESSFKNVDTSNDYYQFCQFVDGVIVQIIQKRKNIKFFYIDKLHLLVSFITALVCCFLLIVLMRKFFAGLLIRIESILLSPSKEKMDGDLSWLQKPIHRIYSTIDSLKEKLVEKEKTTILAKNIRQITHDLGGPISALNVLASKLKSQDSELTPLSQSVFNRLKVLVEDLKDRSAVRTEILENFEFLSSFKTVLHDMRLQYPDLFLRELISLSEPIEIYGNGRVFSRVTACLVQNAMDAVVPGRAIEVSIDVWESDLYVHVHFQDNGKGIKKEDLKRVTLPGISIGKDESKYSGMGLGLAFAFEKTEEWGGTAVIESELGIGTKIKLSLLKVST